MKSLAPWSLGTCLLVSFTATAGQQADEPDAVSRRNGVLSVTAVTLNPPDLPGLSFRREAAAQANAGSLANWIIPPRLEPVSAASLPSPPMPLIFADSAELLPAVRLMPSSHIEARHSASGVAFAQQKFDGSTLTLTYGATASDRSTSSASPTTLASLTAMAPDGATPAIPRAVSLSSATPAPVEPQVVALAPRPAATPSLAAKASIPPTPPARPLHAGYADLIDPEDMSREQRCLAEAVYFEARSETPDGQAAVAQVVLNRVKSGLYPDSVCGVVYQNRHRYMACQFSFACEGKSLRITEPGPWKQAVKIAREVTFGRTYLAKVGNATHYHANYVRPHWSRAFRKNDVIGRHIFYRPKPGQT